MAAWAVTADEVLGLDKDGRILSTALLGESRLNFYGEKHGDLAPFSQGTTAASSLRHAAEDVLAAVAGGKEIAQKTAVTNALSPQKVSSESTNGTGCRPVKGIGIRGTPISKLICPDEPSPGFVGCTGADGNCPVVGLICQSCGAPTPPASTPAPAQPEKKDCTVTSQGPSDGAGGSLVSSCADDGAPTPPPLTEPEAPVELTSRSCTTPPECRETLGNYYSNKMLLAQCATPYWCDYWAKQVEADKPWMQHNNCDKCFGGR